MGEVFGRATLKLMAGVVGASLVTCTVMAQSPNDPPGRVGRLAFVDGTVSFHDDEDRGWTKAVVNTPLTTGDAIWTEPNSRSEVSLAGTRIRMDGSTELDMSQVDDQLVRLQLAQGRIDVKTAQMDTSQPYEIVTPRGTISLQQQGDYYVEAGSQQDPTRLGVRSGAAQIQGMNGQTLAVRPGEVGEVYGDGSSMQLKTVQAAPPAPAASWAARDRQVVYDQQPQYLPAGMTGYEDLNGYGNWINDGSYGQVWVPRSTPAGWAPYRTGHWSYVEPWGWTWIDDQPWGFAPYHYGRWANSNNRWVWVPPQREQRPVYAPALVAFVGGIELAAQLGNQGRNAGPVGWFPLGPREVYVPPYSTNRDYYQRINRAARIQDRDLEDRWQRAQRREAFIAGQNSVLANQRFATVVPSQTFVRSQPVQRAVLNVAADRLAKAAVAPVSAPPAPTASVVSMRDAKRTATPEAANAKTAAEAKAKSRDVAVARTAVADMDTLARPKAAETGKKAAAPGPKIASTDAKAETKATTSENPDARTANPATPALRPRQGAAPPALKETNDKAEPDQAKQEPNRPEPGKQEAGKPAANQAKEAAPAPPKPDLASPDPSSAKRNEQRQPAQKQDAQKPNEPKQAAPDQKEAAPDRQKPNAAPQPQQEERKQAAPAQQPRQAEPRQAAPQPAPKPEAAPRQEAPRQAAPPPRAEHQQQPQQQAQPPRPQPQQQAPQQQQPQRQQQPQPQQQQAPRERETRAPAPQQQQQQQVAQPPQQQQQQQQPQRGNNGGGGGGNKKDKD